MKMFKGGSWNRDRVRARSAVHDKDTTEPRYNNIDFRFLVKRRIK